MSRDELGCFLGALFVVGLTLIICSAALDPEPADLERVRKVETKVLQNELQRRKLESQKKLEELSNDVTRRTQETDRRD